MMKIHSPGTRLGQFEIVSNSTSSGVSIDYTCLDHEQLCPVLLKTLKPELLLSPMMRDRFTQCGMAWSGFGPHPHIVRCNSVFEPENSDEVFLVLPVVVPEKQRDTPSLLSWLIPGRPLPVLQALLFALQIARGMQHVALQRPDFVHGDLKPESILVSGGRLSQADVNRLRVTDFGLTAVLQADAANLSQFLETKATAVAQTQLIDGVVGTPLYMAPEQWRGESPSTATDVYALGCLLYQMLVGQLPVSSGTIQDLRTAHCAGNVLPLPTSLPDVVCDLVARCLALKPGERYQSWAEVGAAIAAAYEEVIHYPVPEAEPADIFSASERMLKGWFLNSMGYVSCEAGNLKTGVKCLELALQVGDIEGDQALVGTGKNNLGVAFLRLGDAQRAAKYYEEALAIAVGIGDQSMRCQALNNLGIAYLQLSDPHKVIVYLEQAQAVAREFGDRGLESAVLTSMGSVYHQLGDLRRSIQNHEQALKMSREVANRQSEGTALANLGVVYSELGDNPRAIHYYEQSLAIKSEIGERYSQIACLNNLGNAYRNLGDARRAFEYYNRALEIAQEMGDRRGEAFALNGMGSNYANIDDMARAIEHHEQALSIFREIGDKRSQGDCLTNLGFIYMHRQDTGRAMEVCEQALTIDREIGDIFGLALDSFNMANLLVQQNRFREALPYAEEAADILTRVGHPGKAPQACELVAMIRAELDRPQGVPPDIATTTPTTLSQQILSLRHDNPTLTANMSDADVVVFLQRANLTLEHGRPMTFEPQSRLDVMPGARGAEKA